MREVDGGRKEKREGGREARRERETAGQRGRELERVWESEIWKERIR